MALQLQSLQCWARPSQSNLGFHNLSCRADSNLSVKSLNLPSNVQFTPLSFRMKDAIRLLVSKRLLTIHASNNPSEGSLPGKPEGTKADTARASTTSGPPLLTIMAGFVALLIVFWIVKSIVLWLISLVFTFPSSK